jgi:hypothetical protein
VRIALLSLVALAPAVAAAREPPPLPPPETGPRTDGIVFRIELGAGGCPNCPLSDVGGELSLGAAYRLRMGLAIGGALTLIGSSQATCEPDTYGYTSSCTDRTYQVAVLALETRFHPFNRSRFDPYVSLGLGSASAGYDNAKADSTGLALVARFGLLAVLSNYLSLGGGVGRTFASWDGLHVGDAWFTGVELVVRIWGP